MGLNAASQDKLCVLGQVCYQVNPDSCILKKKCFNTIFRGYTPFTVTTNYWLYSPCCTRHPWAHLTPDTLCLPLPHI